MITVPLSVTAAPLSERTPTAPKPVVATVVPPDIEIVEPAPVARTPIAPSVEVEIEPPVTVALAPEPTSRPYASPPDVAIEVFVSVSDAPLMA